MSQVQLRSRRPGQVDDLPHVCMRCAAPATRFKDKTFTWIPAWTYLLVPFGALPFALVAQIVRRQMQVRVPLCEAHKGHWFWRIFIAMGGMGALLALGPVAIVLAAALGKTAGSGNVLPVIILVGWFVLFLGWTVGATVWAKLTMIRPKRITDDGITLTGVAPEFAEQARQEPQQPRRGPRPDLRRATSTW
jgi:hypothetical protein